MSYLLNLGVDIDQPDTSGNTPLHYAAGYGWYFCSKMLLDAGANPSIANDWKVGVIVSAYVRQDVLFVGELSTVTGFFQNVYCPTSELYRYRVNAVWSSMLAISLDV
jgi:ankyrin repeat protein